MKNITKLAFLALLLISTNTILAQNTQENDSIITVELNEIVLSTPFKESRGVRFKDHPSTWIWRFTTS